MSSPAAGGRSSYHHGDLRNELVAAARHLIERDGIDALNLRALAQQVGVSQTALYHHFSDKQGLLCAIGEQAVREFGERLRDALNDNSQPLQQRVEVFIRTYLRYAIAHPELYELMLGRTTWRNGMTDSFRRAALDGFRALVELLGELQQEGLLPGGLNPLRLAQVLWGTLHGLSRMVNDGLVFTPDDVEDIGRYAAALVGSVRELDSRQSGKA